jgi:integrase
MNLTDTHIRNLKATDKVQKLSDGGGLYLHCAPTGGKLWRMAYRFNDKQKLLSFGAYPAVSLKDARARRDEAKELLAKDIDPGEEKKERKAAQAAKEKEERETFTFVALEWFAAYSPRLTPKHAAKIKRFLQYTLFPVIGDKAVTLIEPADLLTAVRPTEAKGHLETAHKLMQLCGQVMRYARITGRVKYDVASGLTEALQPVRNTSLAALTDPKAVSALLRDIDACEGHFSVIYFLKILPYVFTRPSELRRAEWTEFDFDKELWRVPKERMKMRQEHSVPLARQVTALLRTLQKFSGNGHYLFPSIRTQTVPISDAAPLAALRRLGYAQNQMCLHGFRATASTNLNELGFRADVIEAQLAHKEPDAVRLAYNRAEYLKERRNMMQAYADFLDELREKIA